MTKKIQPYNLSKIVVDEIKERSINDGRSASSWLDRYLVKQFKLGATKTKTIIRDTVADHVVGTVPCSDGLYEVTQPTLNVWLDAYPDVNVTSELNKVVAWLDSNPKKTVKGCKKFLNSWLNRAQNSAKSTNTNGGFMGKTSNNLSACEDFIND